MTLAVSSLLALYGGSSSGWWIFGAGALAVIPSALSGWVCAMASRRTPHATWPLMAIPGGLLVLATLLVLANLLFGNLPWDDTKMGPLLVAGTLVLMTGPTFLAGLWAKGSVKTVEEEVAALPLPECKTQPAKI
ncbi:MAG: hypothetical protein U0798_17915 [Gemmataceae bacterium]